MTIADETYWSADRADQYRKLLRRMEWSGWDGYYGSPACPCCDAPRRLGHYEGCELLQAISEAA